MKTITYPLLALALSIAATSAWAADAVCAPAAQALQRGLAQARIHAAIDAPLDAEAVRMGMKPVLMHSIVIGQLQHSNAIDAGFSKTPLDSPDMRLLASDLGPFAVEQGCKPAGSARVAGRDAWVLTATGDLGRGDIRLTLWIDKSTGLPLRAVSDEPDIDVDTVLQKGEKGRAPKVEVRQSPNGKRVVSTHAYLFGDAVKPPGTRGEVDAQALAALKALLKAPH